MKAEKNSREMVCIVCPVGCRLTVTEDNGEVKVEGNRCPRGAVYGREEILSPKRVVTATCSLRDPVHSRLPVKTDAPLPYELIRSLLDHIYELDVPAPVRSGDLLIENFQDTGVNIIAGRTIPPN